MDLITLTATCIFACTPVAPSAPLSEDYGHWGERLEGTIRSSAPPESEQEDKTKEETINMALPEWLEGTWRTHTSTLLYAYDYRNHKNLIKKPTTVNLVRKYIRGAVSASAKKVNGMTNLEGLTVLENTEGKLKVSTISVITRKDKERQAIVDIFVEESTIDYEEIDDGLIEVTVTITDYGLDSEARRQSKSFFTESRMTQKAVITEAGSKNHRSNQTAAHGVNSGLGTIVHRQFIEDIAHVGLGGGEGDK
jgi:hypothetical protein